jgi:nucleoside-diphosphate-sugar epimerase
MPSQNASIRELVEKFAARVGISTPRLLGMTPDDLEAVGFAELIEMAYLFDQPLLVDATDTERALGIHARSLHEMIDHTRLTFA